MRLLIDSSNRYLRKISIFDSSGKELIKVQGEDDVLKLIDRALREGRVKLSDLTEVSAKMDGESRVGINIGVAAANALNYALGLKKVNQLAFPTDVNDKFR